MNIALTEKKVFLSSVEIAELTGKEHKNVLRDIVTMFEQLNDGSNLSRPLREYENTYIAENGHEYRCYVLPKREVTILVSGYSAKLRASIIDRLAELEEKKPMTLIDSLETALMLAKQNEQQAIEITRLEAIEEVYKVITDSTQLHTVSEGAKILGTGERRLFELLRQKGILMGDNVPYQRFMNHGYFDIKVKTNRVNGIDRTRTQTFITNKGLDYIKKLMEV